MKANVKVKFNAKNFRMVLDFIERRPDLWDQEEPNASCGCFLRRADIIGKLHIKSPYGLNLNSAPIRDFLGTSPAETEWLFSPWRTIADFERFYKEHTK